MVAEIRIDGGTVYPIFRLPQDDETLADPISTREQEPPFRTMVRLVDHTWQNKNHVFPVQGPSATIAAVRYRAAPTRSCAPRVPVTVRDFSLQRLGPCSYRLPSNHPRRPSVGRLTRFIGGRSGCVVCGPAQQWWRRLFQPSAQCEALFLRPVHGAMSAIVFDDSLAPDLRPAASNFLDRGWRGGDAELILGRSARGALLGRACGQIQGQGGR